MKNSSPVCVLVPGACAFEKSEETARRGAKRPGGRSRVQQRWRISPRHAVVAAGGDNEPGPAFARPPGRWPWRSQACRRIMGRSLNPSPTAMVSDSGMPSRFAAASSPAPLSTPAGTSSRIQASEVKAFSGAGGWVRASSIARLHIRRVSQDQDFIYPLSRCPGQALQWPGRDGGTPGVFPDPVPRALEETAPPGVPNQHGPGPRDWPHSMAARASGGLKRRS